ncbi:pre-rRNA 2'-O-ribose RNA methyltransferase FTSJ3-like [Styela clava]
MGKKTKAKKRKDKFYHLAKETGYRARSAFKLLQLNKKFSFLQTSKVLIDLCAAPGGWLQVASQYMPVSSLILGVDLVPIKPIPNCITFTEDITTEKCKSQLRKELHNWKADSVIHDGAPNVGKNWLHDAFSQSVLTLHALKLACDFLRKGGWFVTKVFRSKDYQSLMWIFNQLFKKVHATKPQASRNESAEIFVVCQGYKAPDKIDKKFFDAKHVFQELTPGDDQITMADFGNKKLLKKAKAVGYKDDATMLYEECTVSEFLASDKPLHILKQSNKLVFDDEEIFGHVFTTDDIVDACKDLKVIGKREFRILVNWHKKMNKKREQESEKGEKENEELDEGSSSDSDAEIEKKLSEMKEDEAKQLKRKKKVVTKERRKLRERMGHMAQSTNTQEDMELFSLHNIKSNKHLETLTEDDSMKIHDKERNEYEDGYESDDEVSEIEFEDNQESDGENSSDEEKQEESPHPLIVPLGEDELASERQTDLWFSKDIFADIKLDAKRVPPKPKNKKEEKIPERDEIKESSKEEVKMEVGMKHPHDPKIEEDEDSGSSSDSDYDINMAADPEDQNPNLKDFEVVPSDYRGATGKLDASGLALGTVIATSRKRKRDIIDDSFNRYTFEDEGLPDWFVEDEKKRIHRTFLDSHIPQHVKKYYESRDVAINSKTIKKVAEAKARKKRKMMKRTEKARKQVENVTDSHNMSNVEKASQIKSIYKKHGMLKKQKENVTYVFAKRGVGKKVRRPQGVKGQFKVVDRRMKTDLRGKMKGGGKKPKRGRK